MAADWRAFERGPGLVLRPEPSNGTRIFIDTYGGVLAGQGALPAGRHHRRGRGAAALGRFVRVDRAPLRRDALSRARPASRQARALTASRTSFIVPSGSSARSSAPSRASPEGRRRAPGAGRIASTETTAPCSSASPRFAIEKRWDRRSIAFLEPARKRSRCGARSSSATGPKKQTHARTQAIATSSCPASPKNREALAKHLANSDALVHGCPFETFGLSIAEAMSCGLPCVVPDDGGANEMHDPGSGERYRAGDANACFGCDRDASSHGPNRSINRSDFHVGGAEPRRGFLR